MVWNQRPQALMVRISPNARRKPREIIAMQASQAKHEKISRIVDAPERVRTKLKVRRTEQDTQVIFVVFVLVEQTVVWYCGLAVVPDPWDWDIAFGLLLAFGLLRHLRSP